MELLEKLQSLKCPAGFENRDNENLKLIAEKFCEKAEIDAFGNVIGYLNSKEKNAPKVLLCAHYDTIGLITTEICERGFLRFDYLGGVDERVLPGAEVTVLGEKEIFGIIGVKPIHILSAEETSKAEKGKNLLIDTGYTKEALLKMMRVGTPAIFAGGLTVLNDNICGNYMDNRAGVYVVLKAAEKLKGENVNVIVLLSASEELGRRGAAAAAAKFEPDVSVIVDATFGKTPWCNNAEAKNLGDGPVICKGPALNRKYTNLLEKTAQDMGISYSVEAEGGDTGTDAFIIETTGEGIPCVMVSYPLKYMHTGIETVNKEDLAFCENLIVEFSKNIKGEINCVKKAL